MADTYNNAPSMDERDMEQTETSQQPLMYNLFGWKQSKGVHMEFPEI